MQRPRLPLWWFLELLAWCALFAAILGALWSHEWSGMQWIRDAAGIERPVFEVERD
jgi:hypothetical protein